MKENPKKEFTKLVLLYVSIIAGLLFLHNPLAQHEKPVSKVKFVYQQF